MTRRCLKILQEGRQKFSEQRDSEYTHPYMCTGMCGFGSVLKLKDLESLLSKFRGSSSFLTGVLSH